MGTSGTNVFVADEDGSAVASATEAYSLHTPCPNWTGRDPRDRWPTTIAAVRGVCAGAGVRPADASCVGLTGQIHGPVLLDTRTGAPRRSRGGPGRLPRPVIADPSPVRADLSRLKSIRKKTETIEGLRGEERPQGPLRGTVTGFRRIPAGAPGRERCRKGALR
ncbi:MAG: FGGY family carbohydrate kinase [Betaproteobacteria bacterium]